MEKAWGKGKWTMVLGTQGCIQVRTPGSFSVTTGAPLPRKYGGGALVSPDWSGCDLTPGEPHRHALPGYGRWTVHDDPPCLVRGSTSAWLLIFEWPAGSGSPVGEGCFAVAKLVESAG